MVCAKGHPAAAQRGPLALQFDGVDVLVATVNVWACECDAAAPDRVDLHGVCSAVARSVAWKAARLLPAEVRFLRRHLRLTTEELASKMKVSLGDMVAWEDEVHQTPMLEIAEQLLRVLVVSDLTPCDPIEDMGTQPPSDSRYFVQMGLSDWVASNVPGSQGTGTPGSVGSSSSANGRAS